LKDSHDLGNDKSKVAHDAIKKFQSEYQENITTEKFIEISKKLPVLFFQVYFLTKSAIHGKLSYN
jgi:hypothetical protein